MPQERNNPRHLNRLEALVRDVVPPLCTEQAHLGLWGPLPSTSETQKYWNKTSEGPLRCFRDWSISYKRGLRELGQFFLEKRRIREILSVSIKREQSRKCQASFSDDWTVATEHRLKYWRFHLKNKYCEGGQGYENLVQRGCGVSIIGEGQKSSGCSPKEIIWVGELKWVSPHF